MVGRSFLGAAGLSDIRVSYNTGNVVLQLGVDQKNARKKASPPFARRREEWSKRHWDDVARLLDGAGHVRENVVGVGADEADRANDDHENDGQHHGVLGDVLALFVSPELAQ